jgi:tetratricopeptide (TPR) repeat protein
MSLPAWLTGSPYPMLAFVTLYVVLWGAFSFGYWTVGGYGVETDAFGSFLPEVKNLISGNFTPLDGFKGPGFHIVTGAASFVVRDLFLSAKVVALVSAGIVLWILFRLIRRRVGLGAAWLTIVIVAFNAQFILFTVQVGTDMLFLALVVGAATLLLERAGSARALYAGLLSGFAYLTRFNGIFLIVAGLCILALADRSLLDWRKRALRTVVFAGGVLAMLAPWAVFTWSHGRGFFYNANYLNIAYEMFGRDVVSWDQFWEFFGPAFTSMGDVLHGNLRKFGGIIARNSIQHVWFDLKRVLVAGNSSWVTPVAALWGVVVAYGLLRAVGRWRWSAWPALFLGALTYGALVPVFYGERFSLPMVPLYALLTAIAVTHSLKDTRISQGLRVVPALCAILLLWGELAASVGQVNDLIESQPRDVEMIASIVGGRLPRGEAILARKPHIAYFLGTDFVRMPFLNQIGDIPEIARRNHARYLFVSGIEAALRPPLAPLLDPNAAPPFLKPLAATSGGMPAVLYELTISIPPKPSEGSQRVAPTAATSDAPQAVLLGRAYLNAGRGDLAEEYFRKALAANPQEPTALLGLIQIEEVRVRSALQNPDSPAEVRSAALRMLGTVEERVVTLANAAQNSRDVQLAAGDFLVRRNKHREAIAAYRRAVAINADDAQILGVLGDLEASTGDYSAAEGSYRRLLRLVPDDAEGMRSLGQTILALNRPAEALTLLRRANKLDGQSLPIRNALARAYKMTGDSTRSKTLWRGILAETQENEPLNFEARTEIGFPSSMVSP